MTTEPDTDHDPTVDELDEQGMMTGIWPSRAGEDTHALDADTEPVHAMIEAPAASSGAGGQNL